MNLSSLETYQDELELNGYGPITTEISMMKNYFLAEEYHQQYLAKIQMAIAGLGELVALSLIINLYIIAIFATLAQLARAVDL